MNDTVKQARRMVEVIGHRGASGLEPENTISSFQKAIDLRVDRIELDVRVSRDGHLIVIHDETVDRTTNGHGYVNSLTLSELRSLDAGKGERVPTLEEVFSLAQGNVVLQVELKAREAVEPFVSLVASLAAEETVVATSFMHGLLAKVHELSPNIRTGALFSDVREGLWEIALTSHSEAIHVTYRDVDADLVAEAHRRGLQVVVRNPDDPDDMKRMIDLGVDAIGTNRPDILINLLRSLGMK